MDIKKGDYVIVKRVDKYDISRGIKKGGIYLVKLVEEKEIFVVVNGEEFLLFKEQVQKCQLQLEKEKGDSVNNPKHYKGNKGIETIDFIENVLTREEFVGYLRGNIIKYQSRANLKGRKEEDLKKAKWYSDKLVEVLKNE